MSKKGNEKEETKRESHESLVSRREVEEVGGLGGGEGLGDKSLPFKFLNDKVEL